MSNNTQQYNAENGENGVRSSINISISPTRRQRHVEQEKVETKPKIGRFSKERFQEGYQLQNQETKNKDEERAINRKRGRSYRKQNPSQYTLEEFLAAEGIDFNKPLGQEAWLPLEAYDDKSFDECSPEEWLKKGIDENSGTFYPLIGKALYKDERGIYSWQEVEISSYNEKIEKFEGVWVHNATNCKVHKLFLLFEGEDARRQAKRIATAFQRRQFADSLIRYNFYIENMPTQDLSELAPEQFTNIQVLSCNTRKLRESKLDMSNLAQEVHSDYARTMNKIIFDKYLEECSKDVMPHGLVMPPKVEKKEVPYYGMIQLDRDRDSRDFTEIFKEFCFHALVTRDEVVRGLQYIKIECNKTLDLPYFYFNITHPMRLEDFKHQQDSSGTQAIYHLKGTWVNEMAKIIKAEFSGVDKGWFNIKDAQKTTYEQGKLKRFLTSVRLNMQDVILSATMTNYNKFCKMISNFVPEVVEINGVQSVSNHYYEDLGFTSDTKKDKKHALFSVDLIIKDNDFTYAIQPKTYVNIILGIFDKILEDLQKIPDIEPKVLQDFQSNVRKDQFIKAPKRPKEKPVMPQPWEKNILPDENKWVWDLYENLKEQLDKCPGPMGQYLKAYDIYKDILKIDPEQYIKDIESEEPPRLPEALRDEINVMREKEKKVRESIPEEIQVSMFNVNCKDIIHYLGGKYATIAKNLTELIARRARDTTHSISDQFQKIQAKIKEVPKNIEELTELKEYIANNSQMEIDKLRSDITNCLGIYNILEDFFYKFSGDDLHKKFLMYTSPKETANLIEMRKNALDKEKSKFQSDMSRSQEEFKENIQNLDRQIMSFHQYQNITQHEEVSKVVATVNESLSEFDKKARLFNNRESLFGLEITDYSKISQMSKEFAPYSNLWLTAHNWLLNNVNWLNCPWDQLDAPSAEKFVDEGVRTLAGAIRFFRDREIGAVLKIAENIKSQVDDFKPKVPLMVALRKPGMKERHWQQISEKIGFKIEPAEGFNFKTVLDMGLMQHIDFCVEVGERAAKEFQIENMLEDMISVWDKILFILKPYKNYNNVYILDGWDQIQVTVDEHMVNTQAMSFSPFKKPFEDRITDWNSKLLLTSNVIEEWMKCQGNWMYLQPIFDSPDIAKQLPAETKRFKHVDATWKYLVGQAKNVQNVLKVCTMEGVLEKLQEANKNLETVQKELNNYLEKKREAFARFYFLSNDELLEILSQTKDPEAVQPHLRKVFENIHRIEFNEGKRIIAMFSEEGEKINFIKMIDPNNKNVEFWMGDVEEMMKQSVRYVLYNAVTDYTVKKRPDWVISHPGQCVLNGSQVHWTSEVEEAIQNKKVNEYFDKLKSQISDLVRLIRGDLTKMQSVTINALIVIDVHARDVVEKLWKANVTDVAAFEWISQLRYYWENDDCYVKCIQTVFPYGYEYLGNTLRLVITPLTDKCYMTLMGALRLNLGGAPAGPAGTGKTESTKDLAKALAKQCVVFNCSEGMDYIFVGKFFKGLASAGAWACFDEFNRINIEVLSVIAQQLIILFGAKERAVPQVDFEGSNIKMNPTFSVFITMNPGYAGRTELPDNLKALFRPVAMMVPDYALIGEIMLYSFGFETARDLARKMVATFKLSSEQLSSQDHYDYGMRAVRSVINAAGLLKRDKANAAMSEDQLLLRALRDVNVPKFLKDDLPLFENIISDLFPSTERPKIDYGDLLAAIKQACVKKNIQHTQPFIEKILQLYDTIQVRHGLMLVGPTGGGKTTNYRILQAAMTDLSKDKKGGFNKVHTHCLNPKSITMGQLYGQSNEQTKEWTDGVLAHIVRETVRDTSTEKHWIMFDGPVDALWIESMNTVLDDNKKLCLNSGQILVLTPHMTMMFEVEDLAVASPATVSRCGMVYMEPGALGMEPVIDSWFNRLPDTFKAKKTFIPALRSLFDNYLESSIEYTKKNCKETVTTMLNSLAISLMKLIDCYFEPYKDTEFKKVTTEEIDYLESMLESIFFFSLVWSIGCTVNLEGRKKFNIFLRDIMNENKAKLSFPEFGTIYDFNFNIKTKQFEAWSEFNKNFEVDPKLSYSEIVVPTSDYTRMLYLMKTFLTNGKHVICPGPTGTGKTLNAYTLLSTGLSEDYQYISLTFSAQTSANQTQDTIDVKLEKRRKGRYGPPSGKKCIIFVDDLNMPKKEQYGAQPPIELLRQYLDHEGWYDRKDNSFRILEDLILLSAMGPPGGGRSNITARLVRHFNMLTYTDLDEETISYIFSTIVRSFFKRYGESVRNVLNDLVESVLYVYNTVKKDLKPTPTKSFYTFNLRDISKVFQGLCSASMKHTTEPVHLVRLWYHENLRVFHDRLTTEQDRDYMKNILVSQLKRFNVNKEDLLNAERIIFGDFMQGRDMDPKPYIQISDLQSLLTKMEQYLEEYNAESGSGKKQMKLVMFLDACEHIARICRILRQPQGNALLLGVGGSGRQSLAKMGTFIATYKLFQIEVVKGYNMSKWRDDVKRCLMMAGVENKQVSFLFVDTQIINEQMLEDINNILNSGDVTNLYKNEDLDQIYNTCRTDCVKKNIQPNKMNMFGAYLARIKRNIHVIIAMSPLGDIFTTRLRMFPSLINCCTIDWFTEWPEEALIGVGKGSLMDYELDLGIQGQVPKLVEMFKNIHKSVERISVKFLQELRRYNYVTPTSYLELLTLFRTILQEKKNELKSSIDRLRNGLEKLKEANEAVLSTQVELKELLPNLAKAEIETEKMLVKLEVDKKEADETQKVVAAAEAEAKIEQAQAAQLANEAEKAVEEAKILLDKTMQDVKELRKDHIVEVKSLLTKNPPKPVFWTMAGVVILLGDKIPLKNIPGTLNQKEEDYVSVALERLNNPDTFLQKLLEFAEKEKEKIPAGIINKLKAKVMSQDDFQKERVDGANFASKFLRAWIMAMYNFNKTFEETKPLRDKLYAMNQLLAQKNMELNIKKEELAKVNATIQLLEEKYTASVNEKERLANKKIECEVKLQRAQKLTSGLADERERWARDVEILNKKTDLLAGDSVVAAGMVAYAGAFTSTYRQKLESDWVNMLDELDIKHTEKINMRMFLGDSVKIQQWNIAGLPKDDTSTENGIIIDKARRWPLMIDPQNQANKFIKNWGKDHQEGLDVLKASDPNLLRTLELSIQFGKWALLENVGRELDPALEPILQQQVIKAGGTMAITIGDKTIPYHNAFKLFMTTTMPNPHYSPETTVKVTIINFAITPNGLEEQMLAQIVALENPQLEQKKIEIVKKNAQDKKDLLQIEDSILTSLKEASGDILMDESLITKLANSKKMSAEISQRVKDSKVTEAQIDTARESYRPVAFRASILFFCIVDLSGIDPMYQYSLQWFTNLFTMAVENSPTSNVLEQRLLNLNSFFTYSLYENICRSLFEKHKLLFSLILAVKILQGKKEMDDDEWRFLLAGASGDVKIPPNPAGWISENAWPDMYRQWNGMAKLPKFKGIDEHFLNSPDDFKKIYDSIEAHEQPLPNPWQIQLDDFEKIIVLKAVRPDKVIPAIQAWISSKLGKQFIESPTLNLGKCFKDATIVTPLIFVLSPGSDPVADLKRFAEEQGMTSRWDQISLGQGQGAKAEKLIKEASYKGGWVLLQNCHLAITWMSELERICEELNDNLHKDFRLWLTSMPTPSFPISVLQNGIKMTLEPPSGLRANLLRSYEAIEEKEFNDCKKPEVFKKLLFGFCLFHAIIQDRRKFGPIGWNIPYEFTNEDLTVCKRQLKLLLEEYQEIPYKVLTFLGSEINYGGRVTDDKDVRLITTIIKTYICSGALEDGFKYSESGIYYSPPAAEKIDYINYIRTLPLNPSPEAFGLHENADITNAQNATRSLLETILSIQPRSTSKGGKSREEVITDIATNLEKKTPPVFDFEAIYKKYPTEYTESMNTVLVQEIIRYNRLLEVMKISLENVKKALKGEVVMSEELELLSNSLYDNQVPKLWDNKGFLSLKPLASWTEDLNERIKFLSNWVKHGTPHVFWISGFFFPQAFITGTLQNYARKHVIAIDRLSFEFRIVDDKSHTDIKEKPSDGCYIYGMFLEGARWDYRNHVLTSSRPKELYSDIPLIWLVPIADREIPQEGIYECPVYKVLSRAGTLSTTGHSTNFVMFIEFPSKEKQDVWIKAGVAVFLALRY